VQPSSESSFEEPVQFKSDIATKVFHSLVDFFIEDYMTKNYVAEKSGWRTLAEIADKSRISPSALYGKHSTLGPALDEPVRRGLIETRIFPGERGRGGEVMRLRIAYDKEPIRDFVNKKVMLGRTATKIAKEQKIAPTTEAKSHRIAVLPFSSMSPDPNDEYFADGMTEELISTISRISSLQVIARTSVLRYKEAKKSIDEIGKELNVGTILEGSVRKSGEKLRITAQLIDSKDSRHLWSETYDRDLKDVFAIQSDIAQTMAQALKVRLFPSEKERISKEPTKNVEAYTWYLKGFLLAEAGEDEDLVKAIECFENAIRLDPNFANAYARLGHIYTYATGPSFNMPYGEAVPKARNLITKALHLDEDSAEAHLALSNIEWYSHGLSAEGRLAEGREIRRAIELNPNYARSHRAYGLHLLQNGSFEKARAELEKASEIDPVLWYPICDLGELLYYERRYEEAISYMNHFQKIFPEHAAMAIFEIAMCYIQLSKLEEAVSLLKNAIKKKPLGRPLTSDYKGLLGFAYAKQGKVKEARAIMEDMESKIKNKILPEYLLIDVAKIHLALGEKDETLRVFESAFERKVTFALWLLRADPVWDDLRSDPRFVSLLNKIGLMSQDEAIETE
jgi:adenylate cyclase